MDHNSDSCENFHAFACNGGRIVQRKKETFILKKQFTKLENYLTAEMNKEPPDMGLKMFSKFYTGCINDDIEFGATKRMEFGE